MDQRVRETTIDRLPKALSKRWEADRVHFEKALRDGDVVPVSTTTVAVSLDAAHGGRLAQLRPAVATLSRKCSSNQCSAPEA